MRNYYKNTCLHQQILAALRESMLFWTLFRRIKQNNQGVTALEFAFVAPIFLMLLTGIVNFGMAYFIKSHMQDVARDTTRRFAVGEMTEAQAEKFAQDGLLNSASSYTGGGGTGVGDKNTLDSQLAPSAPSSGSDQPDGGNQSAGIHYSVDVVPPSPSGTDVTTVISVPIADVALFDFMGILQGGTMQVSVTMRIE